MNLDFDACWRASESRDARFDGRFFIGVHSTGIYCRPICAAPSAKRENVRFYPTAAAAEAAGLRPCRRCRPELAPGTPEWNGGSALVARGVRLISAGYLNGHDVGDLARELCIGERQVRRLFAAHLGASPGRLARTRRVQLARTLIDHTTLPMVDVAQASGFTSLRQFNAAVSQAFGRSPRELRGSQQAGIANSIELRLSYRPPLAWDELLSFLGARAIPGVEEVADGVYRRTVPAGVSAGIVELEQTPPHVLLRLSAAAVDGLATTVERARRLLDLGSDPASIDDALGRDTLLVRLVEQRPGLRVPGAWDGFELAVRAVLGQQVSVQGARTLAGRLVAHYGDSLPEPDGTLTHLFPRPDVLACSEIARIGIPAARAETIRCLAAKVADGKIVLEPSAPFAETRARLLELPGIGPWTAEYVAMRALSDPDAFPHGDLGLRKAGATLAQAEAWRPWRAYAATHLWTAGPSALERAA